MAVVYHNDGKLEDMAFIADGFVNYKLRLFQNDFTPAQGDSVGAFTEADYSGYSEQPLTFGAIVLNADEQAESTALYTVFAHDGGATPNEIFGWYIVHNDGGGDVIMHSERLVGPSDPGIPMEDIGDTIQVTPRKLQGNCPLIP